MTMAPGRIVTQERDRYRVDGYLMDTTAIPPETAVPFELEMKCYKLTAWYDLPAANAPNLCKKDKTPGGWNCGDLQCIEDLSTWELGEVFNYLGDEFCDTIGTVDPVTFEQQSNIDYQNAGVWVDLC